MSKSSGTEPLFFAKQVEFRKWLEKNDKTETELLVGFYKKVTAIPVLPDLNQLMKHYVSGGRWHASSMGARCTQHQVYTPQIR